MVTLLSDGKCTLFTEINATTGYRNVAVLVLMPRFWGKVVLSSLSFHERDLISFITEVLRYVAILKKKKKVSVE